MRHRLSSSVLSRRHLVLAAVCSAAVAACGGSDPGDAIDTRKLYDAFEDINRGMSYAQVQFLVGYDHNAGERHFPTEITYQWETGRGTADYTLMVVTFQSGGVTGKAIAGPRGNRSRYW